MIYGVSVVGELIDVGRSVRNRVEGPSGPSRRPHGPEERLYTWCQLPIPRTFINRNSLIRGVRARRARAEACVRLAGFKIRTSKVRLRPECYSFGSRDSRGHCS